MNPETLWSWRVLRRAGASYAAIAQLYEVPLARVYYWLVQRELPAVIRPRALYYIANRDKVRAAQRLYYKRRRRLVLQARKNQEDAEYELPRPPTESPQMARWIGRKISCAIDDFCRAFIRANAWRRYAHPYGSPAPRRGLYLMSSYELESLPLKEDRREVCCVYIHSYNGTGVLRATYEPRDGTRHTEVSFALDEAELMGTYLRDMWAEHLGSSSVEVQWLEGYGPATQPHYMWTERSHINGEPRTHTDID